MIIGISGKKQSGKDTIASIIQYLTSPLNTSKTSYKEFIEYFGKRRRFESDWYRKQFASKLKDIVCILIGCTREQLEDSELKDDYEADINLYNKLIESGGSGAFHASPFEHCSRTMGEQDYRSTEYEKGWESGWCRNFKGFIQLRELIERERK